MYTALLASSQTLANYLQAQFENDPNLQTLFDSGMGGLMTVSLRNPEEMAEKNDQGLSLWLYRITRDEDRLNDPPIRITPSLFHEPPLPLRLHYLCTPIVEAATANNAEIEQRILGKVLQTFYGHPSFRGSDLAGDFSGTNAELRSRIEPMSLEDSTRIWNALEQPYQLSVSYEVTLANIDSEVFESNVPVMQIEPDYAVIVKES